MDDVAGYYYSAFHFLGIGRASGMGVGAIPLDDIISFHAIFDAPHRLSMFTQILRSIDGEFLAEQRKD